MAIRKIEHVGIMVRDMESSIHFYEDVLGFDVLETGTAGDVKLAFLGDRESGQVYVELIAGNPTDFPNEGRVHHLAFTVDNLEEEIERLSSLGVSFGDGTVNSLGNGSKYIFFNGPDGESLELFQPVQ
ncbi:hypothetical protein A8F94_07965 [Bacillus sp. FJAT-27225]|uniref:VOC family protein n=1 Tax=Bacillus sp. FJAT-27225 TaxID=1743144 RepID=UPI00080C3356|nr:VOC family protein [Bacillus sp. FJAT-27225]OCA87774.1 hypothetical protein A8F94_07965 [Bacillus sp. FJAT-27225]